MTDASNGEHRADRSDARHAPFAGTRVLDMADEKGELCGRLLAHLGADVVRIEPPDGAASRKLPPFAPDGRSSLYFAYRNADKRGVTLDITTGAGADQMRRLLASADIFIETHQPGYLASAGFDPADLLRRCPWLIIASITDFGQSGPYRDFVATDMVGFAMGGMMYRAGVADRPPLVAPGALAYDSTAITAAFAVALAFFQRQRTGRGQHLDISVMESVANLADWTLPSYSQSGGYQHRAGSGLAYPIYRCADGHVRVVVISAREWRDFRAWLGEPDAVKDDAWSNLIFRLTHRDVLDPLIEEFFRDKSKMELARDAQSRGIAVTPLLLPAEALANEHVEARGTFVTAEVAAGISGLVSKGLFEIDGKRYGLARRAPDLGEHNSEVFADSPRDSATGRRQTTLPDDGRRVAPFAGLRVLDFGIGAVGVEVGRLFAEYGADVIKVETGASPDFIRGIAGGSMSAPFASSNRTKRSFGVNLKTEEGQRLVRRLIEDCDVVVENSGTGVMERLGLGYDEVRRINPRTVMFSSQMPGSTGPWRSWVGYGPSTHLISGLCWLWNYPDRADDPAGSQNIYPDHLVGRLGAYLAVAALIERERTGRGYHAETAQFEVPVALLGDIYLGESLQEGSAQPAGNDSQRGAPWGAYPCQGEDEWCVINVRSDDEWGSMRRVMGDPAWARVEELASATGRIERRNELDKRVAEWTALRTSRDVMMLLQEQKVPAGMVQHPRDQAEDPHLVARGYLRAIEQPPLGRLTIEGPAFYGTELADPVIGPAPDLGQHTREICTSLLGLSQSEVDRLIEAGVLEAPQAEAAAAVRQGRPD